MLENQVNALVTILKDKDIQDYAGGAFWNLINAVLFKDKEAGVYGIANVKELIFNMPTALFWDKMERYLFGTFKCYNEQIKMAEKFNSDSAKYPEFVKKQIYLIDKIDDDLKIDYFADLTRCFLLTEMNADLYYKLANFINICTVEELNYVKNFEYEKKTKIDVMIAALYQYGLFEQDNQNETRYGLSSFGMALKKDCLNFNDEIEGKDCVLSYEQMKPLNIAEAITPKEIDGILNM